MKLPSSVKLSGPFSSILISAVSRHGVRWIALRHQDLELVPVLGQQLELEAVGNRIDVPRLGHRLEAAHHEAADLLLVVDEAVGIADHRQSGVTPAIGLVTM